MARALCTPEDRVRVHKLYLKNYESICSKLSLANAPQNYETDCQIFLDKKQAEKYKEAKEKEFPISWGGDHCKLIKKHL